MNLTRSILRLIPATLLPMAIASFPAQAQEGTVTYLCDEDKTFQAEYMPEGARVVLADETLMLTPVATGSGARYSDGETTLYTRGEEAFVEVGTERLYDSCVAQEMVDDTQASEETEIETDSDSAQSTGIQQSTGTQSTEAQTSGTTSRSTTSSQTTVIQQRSTTPNETNPVTTTTTPSRSAQTTTTTTQQTAPAQQQAPVRALW
ncbi:MAG: MliC family protein [Oscillatoriophycideae cyanobacterium NC_groundwater_1537_Pr4_S-0.65um_50_18]|nr:MliC family protein [Oscillatoriophycideae cyanobacterium NC_groundwater_1537_Pr4_S-0.65um_50_18]